MNQFNDGKLCCLPFWNQYRVNRRDPSAKRSPTSFREFLCVSRLKRTFQCLNT
ncbi:MAG: hypothetical protein LBL62_03550 [Planctomycetaceae bacterium]|nr:hypothetical protein [Planctomycetaceae bacterium]